MPDKTPIQRETDPVTGKTVYVIPKSGAPTFRIAVRKGGFSEDYFAEVQHRCLDEFEPLRMAGVSETPLAAIKRLESHLRWQADFVSEAIRLHRAELAALETETNEVQA